MVVAEWAKLERFVCLNPHSNFVLDKSRIDELVKKERMSFLMELREDTLPIKAQEYQDKLIVVKGYHEIYAASILKISKVPYDFVIEHGKSELNPECLTPILEIPLVSHEEYLKKTVG